jgi:hypothetical protein
MAGIALLNFSPTENETPDTNKRVSGFLYPKTKTDSRKKTTTTRNKTRRTKNKNESSPSELKRTETPKNDTPKNYAKYCQHRSIGNSRLTSSFWVGCAL